MLTDRLILRRFTVNDAEDMYNNRAKDPEVTKFLTWPAHTDESITKELLTDWVSKYDEGDWFNRLVACHDVNNPKSGRVMDKAGMKLEGTLRCAGKNNQGICDEVWHSMIRADRK